MEEMAEGLRKKKDERLEEKRPWPVRDEVRASKAMRPWPIGLKREMANLKPKTTSYKMTLCYAKQTEAYEQKKQMSKSRVRSYKRRPRSRLDKE